MQIACLGWGSLVWKSGELQIRGKWFEDGPFLPIEFCRQSNNGRITLVLVEGKQLVRSLWAILACETLSEAKKNLAERENIKEENIDKHIGFWEKSGKSTGKYAAVISEWASKLKLDAVVWTDLPPKFNNKDNKVPTSQEVISYLKGLSIEKRRLAEEYIRNAPPQIDTDYRREIMLKLNWLHE